MIPEESEGERPAPEIHHRLREEVPEAGSCGQILDDACCGNESLKARIDALPAQAITVEVSTESFVEPDSAATSMMPIAEQADESIGNYKLLQPIGEGGFGTVWMAEQIEPVRRRVALKIIKPGMDTKEVIARFEQERQVLAMMDHSNIAKVFDAGTTPTGRPYFVMELVKGMPIIKYCDEAGLGTRERLELFGDVCSAINHAHQKGVIHRDIKPSNVMVTLHGDKPVVKVIDFGIAKATQGKLTDKTIFTRFEQFIGTPVYMSPEQAGMSGLDVDTRSDIYALGILLYELLTGKPPYDPRSLASAGYEEMRRIIREVEPVKPSSRLSTVAGEERITLAKARHIEPWKVNRMVAPDLDWIVMKAIEKDRARRYETASAFAKDIKRFLNHESVDAGPPSATYRLRKFARRHRAPLAAAAGMVALLLAGIIVSAWQAVRATHARRAEAGQRRLAEQNEQRALISEDAAQRAERDTRQRLYAADMVVTQQALREGNLGQAREYLSNHIPVVGQADLRGFEWRYYWEQSKGSQLHTFTGHSSMVMCVAFSPDGRFLASGEGEGQVLLWDVRERLCLSSFQPGGGEVRSIVFHPAGDLLAVGTVSEASLWRLTDIRHPALLKRRKARDARVVFLPDSSRVVIGQNSGVYGYGHEPGFAEIWDYDRNETVGTFENAGGRIALPAGGTVLFTGVRDNMLQRWDLTAGRPTARADFSWPLRNVGCSPDGRWLITNSGETDNRAQLWDGVSLSPIRTLIQHHDKTDIWGVAFSPDSRLAATAHSDQLVRIWTLDSPSAPPIILRGHGSEVWAACFSPDGTLLATGSKDETVRLWDLQAAAQPTVLTNVDSSQWEEGPALSPDGKLLAIGGAGATVELWNLDSMKQAGVLTECVHALRFTRDSKKLVTLGDTVTLKIWDVATCMPEGIIPLSDLTTRNKPFALSPDGTFLVGATAGIVSAWDVGGSREVGRFQAHHGPVVGLTFFPDGRRFVTCGTDRVARIWNVETLRQEGELRGHKSAVYGVAVSADGRLLATASIDGTAKIWDLPDRKELWTLKGHKMGVLDASFNVDGKTLATCSDDGAVKFWNMATGRDVGTWQGPNQTLWAVFSPDGGRLVIVGHPGTAHILNGPASLTPSLPE